MKKLPFVLLLVSALVFTAGQVSAVPLKTSTFDTGNEGWRIWDMTYSNAYWRNGEIYFKNLRNFHGRYPGYLVAPADWRGDFSAAYGGVLSFDMRIISANVSVYDDVQLFGGGVSMYYDLTTPGSHYDLFLAPGNGWKIYGTNNDATADEIQTVLSNLTTFRFMAEYANYWLGDQWNKTYYDNISLASGSSSSPVPEPASIFLMGIGLAGLAAFRKKVTV
jgi:hypothetical protein